MSKFKNKNILLCITGSIAAYKACDIIRFLRKEEAQVQIMLSKSAEKFIGIATLAALSNNEVITDLFPKNPSGGLEHVKLSFEIDFILVLPATANIICKAANGVADDLISTTLSICEQPTIYAPAMNFRMWQNEATIKAVKDLQKRGKIIINPDEGKLASLHSGEGRLANTDKIINTMRKILKKNLLLENKRILVTAGPTRESIDPVRFISNRSSGKMGFALAEAAKNMGGNVTLVSGPVNLSNPNQIQFHNIESAKEMYDKLIQLIDYKDFDYIFMSAAISDYYTKKNHKKIKSNNEEIDLKLYKNPDILKEISSKSNATIIGFALETNNGEEEAIRKLKDKGADYIVLNYANEEGAGFYVNTNHVYIFNKNNDKIELPLNRKDRIAKKIIEHVI
tara:strand:+ start:5992 stop:7179 length:1188 start_codon:yes stop_codon:yes gene_type:complete